MHGEAVAQSPIQAERNAAFTMNLSNKLAVITGASEGIGRAIAAVFAREGADLFVVSRNEEALKAVTEELQSSYPTRSISYGAFDLSDDRQVLSVVKAFQERHEALDVLVNNAGMGRFIPFEDSTLDLLRQHLRLNVEAPFLLTQAFLPMLRKSRGSVVNISSYFAHRMLPGRATTAYSTSKGAVNAFTRAAAFELGKDGIRVNAVAPGTVHTRAVERNLSLLDEAGRQRFHEMVNEIYPLQRLGTPEEIAEMVAFLASDKASWVTGGIFPVDGGLTTN